MTPEEISQERSKRLRSAFLDQEFGGAKALLDDNAFGGAVEDKEAFLTSSAVAGWAGVALNRHVNPASSDWQGIKDGIARGYFKNQAALNVSDGDMFGMIAADYQAQDKIANASRIAAARGESWLGKFREVETANAGSMLPGRMTNYLGLARAAHDEMAAKVAPYRATIKTVTDMARNIDTAPDGMNWGAMASELVKVPKEDRPYVLEALSLQTPGESKAEDAERIKLSFMRGMERYLDNAASSLIGGSMADIEASAKNNLFLTDAQSGEVLAASSSVGDYMDLRDDMRNIATGKLAPLNAVKFAGMNIAGAAENIPMTLGSFIPYVGAAVTLGSFQRSTYNEIRQSNPTMSRNAANTIASISAPFQAITEIASDRFLFGRLPNLKRAFTQPIFTATGAAGMFATRAAIGTATEVGEEFAQGVTPLAVQDIAMALNSDIPGSDWEGFLGEFAQNMPELISTILPLAIVGAGTGQLSDFRAGRQMARSTDMLIAAQYSPESAAKISELANAGKWSEAEDAMRGDWAKINAKGDNVSQVKATAEQRLQAAERLKGLQKEQVSAEGLQTTSPDFTASVTRTPTGWQVTTGEGTIIPVESAEAARRIAVDLRQVGSQQEADTLVGVIDGYYEKERQAETALAGETVQASNVEAVGIVATRRDAGGAILSQRQLGPQAFETVRAEAEVAGIKTGTQGIFAHINGSNEVFPMRVADGAKEIVRQMNLYKSQAEGQPQVITFLHENFESTWRLGMTNGTFSEQETRTAMRALLPAFEGVTALNAEEAQFINNLRTLANDQGNETMLRETVSEMVIRDVLGRDRQGRATGMKPGSISRAIEASVMGANTQEEVSALKSILAAIKAFTAYLKGVFGTVDAITKARDEGKLGEEYDTFINKVLGIDEVKQMESQAVEEGKAMLGVDAETQAVIDAGNMAFSTSRAQPADTSNVTEMPDGAQLVGPTTFSITAYHGTPYQVDRFRMAKIGTGEGAQAFGWGLYMAASREIAEGYRKKLSGDTFAQARLRAGMPAPSDKGLPDSVSVYLEDLSKTLVTESLVSKRFSQLDIPARSMFISKMIRVFDNLEILDAVIRLVPVDVVNMLGGKQYSAEYLRSNPTMLVYLLSSYADNPVSSGVEAINVLSGAMTIAGAKAKVGFAGLNPLSSEDVAALRAGKFNHVDKIPQPSEFVKGNLYTVELLPDEEDFLDWDKPLSEQSEKVKAALANIGESPADIQQAIDLLTPRTALEGRQSGLAQKQIDELKVRLSNVNLSSGAQFYNRLGEAKVASEMLAKAGIPGIRYLDGSSRAAGEGTSNYVIFDESLVKILEENGQKVEGPTFSISLVPENERITPENKVALSINGKPAADIFAEVKKRHGITRSIYEAGYVLPDGTMLDFTGRADVGDFKQGPDLVFRVVSGRDWMKDQRGVDHREIEWQDMPDYQENWERMVGFLRLGAVRVDARSGMISMHSRAKITAAQSSALKSIVVAADGAYIDLEDDAKNRSSMQLNGGKWGKVNGLLTRWANGETPEFEGTTFSISPVTPAQDAEYLAAVEAGDVEKAQRMVDEAAKKAGETLVHSRTDRKFASQKGVFVSDTPVNDKSFGANAERHYFRAGVVARDKDVVSAAQELGMVGEARRAGSNVDQAQEYLSPNLVDSIFTEEDRDALIEELQRRGFDSAEIEDVVVPKSRVVFSPAQIKSADPVTYDESGQVIPLSQRFNETTPDIRFSISPIRNLNELSDQVERNFAENPVGALEVKSKVIRQFAKLADKWSNERWTPQGNKVRPISEKRTVKSLDKKQAMRQATLKGEKIAANMDAGQAQQQAKTEAQAWRTETDAMQKEDWSPRESLVRDLITLEAIVAMFPQEIRGKIGGFVALARKASEAARLKVLQKQLERGQVLLEKHLKDQYGTAVDKLFDKYRPERKAGEKPKGKLDPDAQEIADKSESVMDLNADQVNAEIAAINVLLDADNISAEDEAKLEAMRELVQLLGNWKNADSARRESAFIALNDVLTESWAKWKMKQILKREQREEMRKELKSATGKKGVGIERDKMKKEAAKVLGKAARWVLNLSSFSEVMRAVFGENASRQFIDNERNASNQYEDAIQKFSERIDEFFTTLTGGVLRGERLRFDLAQPTLTIGAGGMNERNISQLQGIQALLMWQQEDGRRHMEGPRDENGAPIDGKWSYDQAWIDELTGKLTPEAVEVKKFIEQLYGEEWVPLNAVYRERHGVNLPRHDKYAPITVTPQQAKAGEMVDPVSGAAIAGSILTPGSLRSRNRSALAEPDFRDALSTFIAHTKQMEHWKAYYDIAIEMQAVLGNRDVSNSVKAAVGDEGVTVLRKWIDVFAQGGTRDAAAGLAISGGLGKLAGRVATVGLLGRFSTLLVQSTQLAAASVKMPTGSYLKRLALLMSGNLQWSDAINSEFIQRRIKSAPPLISQAMQSLGEATRPNEIKRVTRYLGQLLSGADGLFTAGTYAILLDYHRTMGAKMGMEGNALESYAHAEAVNATEQVAQPVRTGARSIIEVTNTNPLAKMSWAYASEARQKMALFAWSAYNAKNDPAGTAKTAFLVFVVGGLMSQLLKNLWREAKGDDDEKKWSPERLAMSLLSPITSAIPGASMLAGEGGSLSGAQYTQQSIKDVFDGKADMKDVDTILSAMGYFNDTAGGIATLSHAGYDFAQVLENAFGEE